MKTRFAPARVVAVLVVAPMLVLTACSSDKESAAKPSASASPSKLDTSGISPQNLPRPPALIKAHGAVSALALDKCPVEAGKQTVTGTITSPAKKTTSFLVVVNWATEKGDVKGRGFTVLRNVKPAEKRNLSITAQVADGAAKCVPFVQYGTVKR